LSDRSAEGEAASVKARLLALSKQRREDFNLLLQRYAAERFRYRLSRSRHCQQFVLKGATLFWVWLNDFHRPTRDVDLLGFGDPSLAAAEATFAEVCRWPVEPDGVLFDEVRPELIREGQRYGGVRIRLAARLGSAKLAVRVDVGFGDAIATGVRTSPVTPLLTGEPFVLLAYPRETVVAEKLQAIVALDAANSRIKDFYDLLFLSRSFAFEGSKLHAAILATFERRQTPVPVSPPFGLTQAFAALPDKAAAWKRLLGTGRLPDVAFPVAIADLSQFLMPVCTAVARDRSFDELWLPLTGWTRQ